MNNYMYILVVYFFQFVELQLIYDIVISFRFDNDEGNNFGVFVSLGINKSLKYENILNIN